MVLKDTGGSFGKGTSKLPLKKPAIFSTMTTSLIWTGGYLSVASIF